MINFKCKCRLLEKWGVLEIERNMCYVICIFGLRSTSSALVLSSPINVIK